MDFAKDKISVLFNKIFYPTLLGMLSVCAVTAVDGIFVGHGTGSDGIAAVNICIPLLMLFTGLGLMSGIGCSVTASIALSKGKIKSARLNVTRAMVFISVVTLAFSVLMMSDLKKTAYVLGSSDHLSPLVEDYLFWFVPSLVFEMIIIVSMFVIRLDGAPKAAMWYSFISSAINVVLDWLFIFPMQTGVKGAALATAISVFAGGILSVRYLLFRAKFLRFHPLTFGMKSLYPFMRDIANQCRIGVSALLAEGMMAILMFMGNRVFMRYLGDDGVGAFGISCYYMPFVFMVGNAIAQSAQPVISYNYGIANYERTSAAERIALKTAVVSGALAMICFMLMPRGMVGLFLDVSVPAAQLAVGGLPYFATGFICFIVNLTAVGYFQSVENVKAATVFSMLRGGVFLIPSFLIMPRLLGTEGIWLAMPVSELFVTLSIGGYCLLKKYNQSGRING